MFQGSFTKWAVAAMLCLCFNITAGEESEKKEETKQQVPVMAGSQVYLNPVTGEPGAPTPATAKAIGADKMFNSSHAGLVEAPAEIRGGGVKLDLQGRFLSAVSVTTDANGKMLPRCTQPHSSETPHVHAAPATTVEEEQ